MAKLGGMKSDKGPSDHGAGGHEKSEWLRGYIGGETPGAAGRGFGDVGDWDGDEGDVDTCCEHGDAPGFSKADKRRGYKTVR